jgi:hypothetical protein
MLPAGSPPLPGPRPRPGPKVSESAAVLGLQASQQCGPRGPPAVVRSTRTVAEATGRVDAIRVHGLAKLISRNGITTGHFKDQAIQRIRGRR